jgi:glycosyltransferase involved in cell wall biosynthesis
VTASEASISVVLPVRNGEPFLAEALASVFAQTVCPREVIVVDDGSTDCSAVTARRFPVRLIRQEPLGVSAARNAGVASATGDLVAFIDHDDVWEPVKLQRQLQALAADPEVAYAVCRVSPFVAPGIARPAWVTEELVRDGFVGLCAGGLMAPRSMFADIGGFDPALAFGEDAEWLLRAQDAGARRACPDEILLRYRIHGGNTTGSGYVGAPEVLRVLRMALARRRGEETYGAG